MLTCPVCGFRNPDANVKCFRCSALLKRNDGAMREATSNAAKKIRRERLRNPFARPIDWLRHRPWISRMSEVPDDGRYRYPFTAGLLSLIPGAGHLYAGQGAKGAVTFTIWLILIVIAIIFIRGTWSNYFLFGVLLFWLIVWADSVATAARANGDIWRFQKTLVLVFGFMMIVGVSISAVQFFGLGFFSLEKVTTDAMRPYIRDGDRLLFTSVPLWIREPRPGEVVMFDPPRFEATQGKNVYSINISKYFQRVLGAPGDHVVKRGGKFYRNGKLLPLDEQPFNGRALPDFDLVVPPGHYFVPVTDIPEDMLAALFGSGSIGYVGQPGYSFADWPAFAIVPEGDIRSVGVAVIDKPPHRRWL